MNKLYYREKYLNKIRGFYQDTGMIKVITGVRRCGKSSLLLMIMNELKKIHNVKEENIISIHLDKRPYKSIKKADQLEKLIDDKSKGIKGIKYLFIDEIQNVTDFEEVINAFREEDDFSIFITGSNSYLLSGELSTKLTGRYIEFEMSTLTFDEYLGMKKLYKREISTDLDREFVNYILEGGFPYEVNYESIDDKRTYVTSVVNEIYEKDIRKNKKIKKKEIFNKIQTYIINNFGAPTSVDSIVEYLNKHNSPTTKTTVYSYLRILEDAKIISKCQRFDMKSKKSLNGDEKYYLSDLSFYFVNNTDNKINYGPVLENVVYNYLKSKGYKISVGRIGKYEVDFIIRNNVNDYAFIQVARTIDNDNYDETGLNKTEEREYRPLEAMGNGYPKYLLTMDKFLQKRNGIIHLNIVDMMNGGVDLL